MANYSVPFDADAVFERSAHCQMSPKNVTMAKKNILLGDIHNGQDAILVVNSGQSNAFGSNKDGKLPEKFYINDNVFAFDKNIGDFVVSRPMHYQADGEKYDTQISFVHSLCCRLQEETGKKVFYLQYAYGSKSIVNWTNDKSDPNNQPAWDFGRSLLYLTGIAVQKLSGYGVVAPNLITWFQGEEDAQRDKNWYASQFDTMVSRFESAGIMWRGITPMIVCEPLKGGYGDKIREMFLNFSNYGIDYTVTARTEGLKNDGVTTVHLSSDSYWELGYDRIYEAILTYLSIRGNIFRCNSSNLPHAKLVPKNSMLIVDDPSSPYIAISDGANFKKVNVA